MDGAFSFPRKNFRDSESATIIDEIAHMPERRAIAKTFQRLVYCECAVYFLLRSLPSCLDRSLLIMRSPSYNLRISGKYLWKNSSQAPLKLQRRHSLSVFESKLFRPLGTWITVIFGPELS